MNEQDFIRTKGERYPHRVLRKTEIDPVQVEREVGFRGEFARTFNPETSTYTWFFEQQIDAKVFSITYPEAPDA